jgi:hypothetical protein
MGGKARTAKQIATYLESIRNDRVYFEPFVGAANVICRMTGTRIGSDSHPDLIMLLRAVRDGIILPDSISQEEYYKLKAESPSVLRGLAGFGCSFGGKWYAGYARSGTRNYCKNAKNSLLKKQPGLQGVELLCQDYRTFNPVGQLIYCLHPETNIRLQNEQNIFIKDVKEDMILHGEKKVLKTMSREHKSKLYKIKIQGMPDDLVATYEHQIPCIKDYKPHGKKDEQIWNQIKNVNAGEISVGDCLLTPLGGIQVPVKWAWPILSSKTRNTRKIVNFKECLELYRFIGYYAAEGHLDNKKSGDPTATILSFNYKEKLWHDDVIDCVKQAFGLKATIRQGPRESVKQVCVYSKTVAQFINEHIFGTALTKKLCDALMIAPIEYQKQILIGWLRGDGGLEISSRNRVKLNGTSASETLARQMYQISLRCGLRPSFKRRKTRDTSVCDIYFAGEDAHLLGWLVPCKTFKSTRKIINGYMFSRVRKIEQIDYDGLVYDLDVNKDNYFSANNVLVHNCDPPYRETTGYYHKFDSDEFWDVVRKWSAENIVVVSEYSAPEDFKCVLEMPTKTDLRTKKNGKEDRIERLYEITH